VLLRHGITSVFNLRGFPEHLDWRARIAAGEIVAPWLYTSGEFVNEPRVTTPEQARAEVRAQAQAGYDMIKFREVVEHGVGVLTTHGVDRATFDAFHAARRELGIPALGHAPHGLGLEAVIENGHTLAHMGELVQLHFFPRQRPVMFWPYLGGLGVLAGLGVLGLAARPVWRTPATRYAPHFLLAAACGAAAFGLAITLIPGGQFYGEETLIGAMALLFVAMAAFGLWSAQGAWFARPAGVGGAMSRFAVLAGGGIALAMAISGLVSALPIASKGTAHEMQRVAARLAESDLHVGTTLVLYDEFIRLRRGEEPRIDAAQADYFLTDFRLRFHGARSYFGTMRWDWRSMPSVELVITRYHDFTRELTGHLHAAGVPLLAGTDAFGVPIVPPGQSMHAELDILVEAGLSPYEALRTATMEPARFLGREGQFGVIAPGARADMVLVAANPLYDLVTLREPQAVVLAGRWLPRGVLDEKLSALKE
jgi:hypothetical protein